MELIGKTNINFLGKRRFAYVISAIFIALSFYVWFDRGESRYDIDFTGGHEFVVRIGGGANSELVREAVAKQGLDDAIVQSFEGSDQFSIRVGGKAEEVKVFREKITSSLKEGFPGGAEILKSDFVGPTVGKELKQKALFAIIFSLIGIVIYITYRFEFAFALGALVALVHDVIVATGVYLFAGHDVNMATVAAALTIIGYSVNDTIVIFDKVREEIFKRKDYDLISLMNECINQMLSRTIITNGLTLFSALALFILGGGSISDLSFYLVAGIITGTYSTVFVATPVVFTWESFRAKRQQARQTVAANQGR